MDLIKQLFYTKNISKNTATLDEEESRHLTLSLRKKETEMVHFTDGKGYIYSGKIGKNNLKNKTVVLENVQIIEFKPHTKPQTGIAISPIKNVDRFEWFIEKATELGVKHIYPIVCDRTEKTNIRLDRMEKICISAMKQCLNSWQPIISAPQSFKEFLEIDHVFEQKIIAHCEETSKTDLLESLLPNKSTLVLIGPEGDFTGSEINVAIKKNFMPTSLGDFRLRTETAGVYCATIMNAFLK
ncbi:MAG: 16S rRNA (uracil(1498)-N(3))-methyltransferase [Saprospiraceae bacterium]|nr:16S rRNA (uracil(1498)-N(3))-methyltransferase [Saprospiraceae bacterium]